MTGRARRNWRQEVIGRDFCPAVWWRRLILTCIKKRRKESRTSKNSSGSLLTNCKYCLVIYEYSERPPISEVSLAASKQNYEIIKGDKQLLDKIMIAIEIRNELEDNEHLWLCWNENLAEELFTQMKSEDNRKCYEEVFAFPFQGKLIKPP